MKTDLIVHHVNTHTQKILKVHINKNMLANTARNGGL